MWSAAVLDPACPVRSCAARNSSVLSHHTPIGWNPKVRLNVGAACSFSLCATTIVASTSSTTTSPEVGAGDLGWPAARRQLRPDVAADPRPRRLRSSSAGRR